MTQQQLIAIRDFFISVLILAFVAVVITSCKRMEERERGGISGDKFVVVTRDCDMSHCITLWRDTNTGKRYLTNNHGGILEYAETGVSGE